MEKKAAEGLREYCRKTIEDSGHLITREEFKTLLEEFELIPPGAVL